MGTIRLTDAARYHQGLPHQLAAWNWLQGQLTTAQLQEFAEVFRAAPAAKAPLPAPWLRYAVSFLAKWEGCRLEAYVCSAGYPTIGYGSRQLNNRPVRLTDRIEQAEADALLEQTLMAHYGPELMHLLPMAKAWPPHKVAALVSWAYNVGLGAVAKSSLCARLLAGEEANEVIRQELPRWSRINGEVSTGLKRRRQAEIELFTRS